MSIDNRDSTYPDVPATIPPEKIITAEVVEPSLSRPVVQPRRPGWQLPLLLFLLTCATTFLAGGGTAFLAGAGAEYLAKGLYYSLAVMTIFVCHEMGHFIQARRYGVPASLPYFIPLPNLFGTMGAVIAMDPRVPNRKALFDIGATGPIFGLVPTMVFLYFGLVHGGQWVDRATMPPGGFEFGDPLILQWMAQWILGPAPENHVLVLGTMAWAGWIGLLITSLNLIPIGQLDGGHVLYSILGRRAHPIAQTLLIAAAVATLAFGYYWWILMLALLFFVGPIHPPTRNDAPPIGWTRTVLGWALLAFIIIGFTPNLIVSMPGW